MSIPTNERRDDIIYFLLNKVKHSADKPEDITYSRQDFDGKVVEKDEVIKHLEYAIEKDYLKGEMEKGDSSAFAVCKNAQITPEGLNVLRTDFFKV